MITTTKLWLDLVGIEYQGLEPRGGLHRARGTRHLIVPGPNIYETKQQNYYLGNGCGSSVHKRSEGQKKGDEHACWRANRVRIEALVVMAGEAMNTCNESRRIVASQDHGPYDISQARGAND